MAEKTREAVGYHVYGRYYILALGQGSDYLVLLTDTGRNSHLYTVFETRVLKRLQKNGAAVQLCGNLGAEGY